VVLRVGLIADDIEIRNVETELRNASAGAQVEDARAGAAVADDKHKPQDLTLLAVMVPEAPYAEPAERRRRIRYAVLSGLNRSGLVPEDQEHISFFTHYAADDPKQAKPAYIPYEFLQRTGSPKPAGKSHAKPKTNGVGPAVVLWIPTEGSRRCTQAWLSSIFADIASRDPHLRFAVLGPQESGTLTEMVDTERAGCTIGPNNFSVTEQAKGKRIAIFAVPGAFTPTCSAKHVPSYVQNIDKLRAKGVDEIWCIAVNDAFVMGAWGKDQKADGKVLMLADGNGEFTKAVDLELDARANGLGIRSKRYAMVVDNGVVKTLNVEAPGAFEVSSAEAILKAL